MNGSKRLKKGGPKNKTIAPRFTSANDCYYQPQNADQIPPLKFTTTTLKTALLHTTITCNINQTNTDLTVVDQNSLC
ncbi:MAG: hypothetical protein BA874_02315 [Desulfuromonadales bacterium C00003068]|jgi:hypothetical protein|nr:MAG: hypothetical protein BA874_02315 [Desulfuromonadales bacterium C00003068]